MKQRLNTGFDPHRNAQTLMAKQTAWKRDLQYTQTNYISMVWSRKDIMRSISIHKVVCKSHNKVRAPPSLYVYTDAVAVEKPHMSSFRKHKTQIECGQSAGRKGFERIRLENVFYNNGPSGGLQILFWIPCL